MMSGREFDIIEQYFAGRVRSTGPGVLLGPGDDCALFDVPAGQSLCVSTDTFVAGIHFQDQAPGHVAASRAMGASLSDLAAMGASTFGFFLALTLPQESDTWLESFSSTIVSLADHYGVPLAGGNLSRGSLSMTLTVLGLVPAGRGLRRSGARVGDNIYISGSVGDAAGALSLMNRSLAVPDRLRVRYETPVPRLALGEALLPIASAAIDVSDGLAADVSHLCTASKKGARIDSARLPISDDLREAISADELLRCALAGGDDYELCFTAAPDQDAAIRAVSARLGLPITAIGTILVQPGLVLEGADAFDLDRPGYEHF